MLAKLCCLIRDHNYLIVDKEGVKFRRCLRCGKNNFKTFREELYWIYKSKYRQLPINYPDLVALTKEPEVKGMKRRIIVLDTDIVESLPRNLGYMPREGTIDLDLTHIEFEDIFFARRNRSKWDNLKAFWKFLR